MLCHGRLFPGHRARQTVRPKDGRDRARPSKEDPDGGPCSGHGRGRIRDPMEGHAPSWPQGDDAVVGRSQRRTRQSASLQGRPRWRAMLCHGRGRIRDPMEGHAPSWPQGDDAVVGRSQRRTRQSASLQGRPRWRAMLRSWPREDPGSHGGPCSVMAAGDDAVAGRFQRTSCGPVLPAFPCHHFCSQ
jgi:hypothetical protein